MDRRLDKKGSKRMSESLFYKRNWAAYLSMRAVLIAGAIAAIAAFVALCHCCA